MREFQDHGRAIATALLRGCEKIKTTELWLDPWLDEDVECACAE